MNTRKLRHAVVLARSLNFTRAAKDLNLSQSALSRSIQSLEEDCGLQLFDRSHGAVALTQAGRQFVRQADSLLRKEAALQTLASNLAEGVGGHITVGVTPLVARVLLAPVLSARIGQAGFHADVIVRNTTQILSMLAHGTVDLGVCVSGMSPANAPFKVIPLSRLRMAAIVRRDHPLERMASFEASDLHKFPNVRSVTFGTDDIVPVAEGAKGSGISTVSVDDYEVLNQIVATSDAVWITAPVAAERGIKNGELIALPMPWYAEAEITLSAYFLARRTLSPLANSMLEHLKELGEAIVSGPLPQWSPDAPIA